MKGLLFYFFLEYLRYLFSNCVKKCNDIANVISISITFIQIYKEGFIVENDQYNHFS